MTYHKSMKKIGDGMRGENIGDFRLGSKGGEQQTLSEEEQERFEKTQKSFRDMLEALKKKNNGELVSYLEALSPDEIKHIDRILNIKGMEVYSLQFTEQEQEKDMVNALKALAQGNDIERENDAAKKIEAMLS
jgi:hypothetical protein